MEINEFYQMATMLAIVLLPIVGAAVFQLWDKFFQKNHKQFKNNELWDKD